MQMKSEAPATSTKYYSLSRFKKIMAFRNPESRFGFFLIPTLAICFFAFCYMQTGRADIRYELRVAVCATWISIATLVLLLIFSAIKNRFRFQIQTLFELTMVVAIILAGFSAQTFLQKRLTKLEAKQERLTRLYRLSLIHI